MRARTLVSFLVGFAAGAVFVAALVFATGMARGPAAKQQEADRSLPSAPDLPDTAHPPEVNVPTPMPQMEEMPHPNAMRDKTPAPLDNDLASRNLLMPVRGASAKDVLDTFDQTRGGGARKHEASDIMAPRNTPVVAADEGNIVKLFTSKAGGLTIYEFDDSRTYCYYYAHLDHYAPGLKEGMLVRRGQVIGYVGTTGDAQADAPHLHFAIFRLGPEKNWWQGTPINPYPLLVRKGQ